MPRFRLTDRVCSTAKPGVELFDEVATGLALRITPAGHKGWCFHYTLAGKRARLTLGSYPSTGLAEARAQALEARHQVEAGIDPRNSSRGSAMTVADAVRAYTALHCQGLKSARQIENRFNACVLPMIGKIRLAELHRRDISRCIDAALQRGKPTQARHVFGQLQSMLRWLRARGDIEVNPTEGMTRPRKASPRTRVLSDNEIALVWPKLDDLSPTMATILRLALVTGQRIGEVVGLRREEIDLAARLWKLPGERVKNGKAHTVPLSDLALELLQPWLIGEGGRLFAANPWNATTALYRVRAGLHLPRFTPHDFRRTCLTGLAKLGVQPLTIAFIANHSSAMTSGATLSVYVKYTFDAEKREALDLWSDRLRAIVAGNKAAKVLPLQAARP